MRTVMVVLFGAALLAGLAGCNGQKKDVSTGSAGQRQMWSYTVLPDDDGYAKIAQRVYGDQSKADDIARANPKVPQSQLHEGMNIMVPAMEGIVTPPRGCKRIDVY